jgi:glyoxylase-like metal-dependent hydrolase (beta-lactamase superfamily II)
VREVREGVWWWQASHPDWEPDADWPETVSSYAIDTGDHLVLIDPLGVPAALARIGAGRTTVVVLTCPWHRRDAARLGHPIHVPPPDPPDPDPVQGEVFRAGDRLDVGVEAFPGLEPNDLVLWIESRNLVVAGDTLIDRGDGLGIPLDWAERIGTDVEQLKRDLRPLLDRPVELVLPTHGPPADRVALERALA